MRIQGQCKKFNCWCNDQKDCINCKGLNKSTDNRNGYNTNLFQIKCNKCKSTNCSIEEHKMCDSEDEVVGSSWHIVCNDCSNSDI